MSHPTLDLKRAYLALRRAVERAIKPFGFTSGQFDVLQFLMHEPEIEHRELQRRLTITSPTLTNVVDVLERKGHVARRTSRKDARVKTIAITDAARRVCHSRAFFDAGDALVEHMFDGFTAQERRTFAKLLLRVEKNLDKVGN